MGNMSLQLFLAILSITNRGDKRCLGYSQRPALGKAPGSEDNPTIYNFGSSPWETQLWFPLVIRQSLQRQQL